MQSPRTLPVAVSGLVFTTLALGLPVSHLGLRAGGLAAAFLLLPVVVLGVVLATSRLPALTHAAFPLAHVPMLLYQPELAGARVYAGPSGFVAFLAVLGAGAAYLVAVSPRLTASRARPEPLAVIAAVLALAPVLALFAPALSADSAPWASLLCLAIGPLAAWWIVAGAFVQEVALPTVDAGARKQSFYRLRERSRPRVTRLVLAVVAALVALGLVGFWTFWSVR